MLDGDELSERVAADALRELPFVVSEDGSTLNYWWTQASGDQDGAVELGEDYARMALSVARSYDMPDLIAFVLRDMARSGRFTGLEAGFVMVISSAARAGSMH